ncbi:MAG: hypothetical protein ACE5Q6_14550 [Dehalococcoidia bacterium]
MTCYAEQLGDCRGQLSREHYISRSVLETAGNGLRVSGFPWQAPNESMNIGSGSLVSRALCQRHNSCLSPLDTAGKSLLQALKSIFNDAIEDREFNDEEICLEGDKIELWLLKILCGLCATSNSIEIPSKWLNVLFEQEPFADNHGLYIFGQAGGGAAWYFNLVRVISVLNNEGRIAGAKFGVGGLSLLLAFGEPKFEDEKFNSIYRPESILVKKGGATKTLKFSSGNYIGRGSLELHVDGVVDGPSSEYVPMVGPYRNNELGS